jgi:hypothetical protein
MESGKREGKSGNECCGTIAIILKRNHLLFKREKKRKGKEKDGGERKKR